MTALTIRPYAAPIAAFLALCYLVAMWAAGARPERTHLIRYESKGVMANDPASIVSVAIGSRGRSTTYVRQGGTWTNAATKLALLEKQAAALETAVKFMHTANPVRVFTSAEIPKDAKTKFGFSEPVLEVSLADRNGIVMEAEFGGLSSDGFLHYLRVKNRPEIFMMSRFVLKEWQKL